MSHKVLELGQPNPAVVAAANASLRFFVKAFVAGDEKGWKSDADCGLYAAKWIILASTALIKLHPDQGA